MFRTSTLEHLVEDVSDMMKPKTEKKEFEQNTFGSLSNDCRILLLMILITKWHCNWRSFRHRKSVDCFAEAVEMELVAEPVWHLLVLKIM